MQFSNSLHLGRVGSFRDSDVRAFAVASGATDLGGLNDLAKYVKAQGLWNNFRIYPMKSAQNAGSGPTVYGLGGLTSNNATLVSSPTWGASGISFTSASSQYASILDFLPSGTLTVFARTNSAGVDSGVVISQNQATSNLRSWTITESYSKTASVMIARSADGGTTNFEIYDTNAGAFPVGVDSCIVAQWIAGGGRGVWLNKTAQSLNLIFGSPQTTRFNSPVNVLINASNPDLPANFGSQTMAASAFLTGPITTTQRETITDLINAL